MTTLLKQLEFLMGSLDGKNTHRNIGSDTFTLKVKNPNDIGLVQRIASKMGIASHSADGVVNLCVATPLKEQNEDIPETDFQKVVHRLLDGHGGVMGLIELTTFLYQSNRYSNHDVYANLSVIEQSFIKSMGWNIDFRSGLGYVQGCVKRGTHGGTVVIKNDLLDAFFEGLNRREYIHVANNFNRNLLCGFGSDYYKAECIHKSTYKDKMFTGGEYGRGIDELIMFFTRNVLAFPNGERITLNLVNKRGDNGGYKNDYRQDFDWSITPPSTGSRWYLLMNPVTSPKAVRHIHSNGLLQQFLDVEHCECEPKAVTVPKESLDLIRDAVSSYMEDGVYSSFDHAIVGDNLEVWLTKGTSKTDKFKQSNLRKTRKAFEEAVTKLTNDVIESYDNPITIV